MERNDSKLTMNAPEYIALEEQYNARNYRPLDVVLTRGNGVWVKYVRMIEVCYANLVRVANMNGCTMSGGKS